MSLVLRAGLSLISVIAMMISPALCPCMAAEFTASSQSVTTATSQPAPQHSCCHKPTISSTSTGDKSHKPSIGCIPASSGSPDGPTACLCQAHSGVGCLEARESPANLNHSSSFDALLFSGSGNLPQPMVAADFHSLSAFGAELCVDHSLLRQNCLLLV